MLRLAGLIVVSAVLLVSASCGSATQVGPLAVDPGLPQGPADLDLPNPRGLPSHAGAAVLDEVNGGAFYLEPNPIHEIDGEGSSAIFMGNWDPDASSPREPAYCMYGFNLGGNSPYSLELEWAGDPPACWAGLANYTADRWEWHPAGSPVPLPRNPEPYLSPALRLAVIIVVTDLGDFQLDRLWVNDNEGMGLTNLFFLHHSTGQGIINGGVREYISDYNDTNGTAFEFWDHCYTWPDEGWPGGLVGPDGVGTGTGYDWPCDATDPWDLYQIWTSVELDYANTRNQIVGNHEVIAFKSCFPASAIESEEMLNDYQTWYLAMRDFFDTRPDRVFVVMSTPPLHPAETNIEDAGRAREFSGWLKSEAYLDGHPNVVCFDLFDELAMPLGSGMEANMLHEDYRPEWVDSHPNELANQTIAPLFAQCLIDAGLVD